MYSDNKKIVQMYFDLYIYIWLYLATWLAKPKIFTFWSVWNMDQSYSKSYPLMVRLTTRLTTY